MQDILKEMIEAGVHFGHPKHQWNPKMSPYIYKEQNGIHIIDIIQTCYYLKNVTHFLEQSTAQGKKILFVGTKKQAAEIIKQIAIDSNTFFVNQRWLGGLLTNWSTLRQSIMKLNRLQNIEISNSLSKKNKLQLQKKRDKLEKYIGGLKNMSQLPDIIIIIGQQKELNAISECRKLGLRTITLLDTNCNPLLADLFVPANDDSISSIKFILNEFLKSIKKGQNLYLQRKKLKN
uniref:Small ribosomal subunit protein uS2c n=1 Tax=Derbesia sp. WEST4838 TaxID=1847751 RepID=A0A1C9JBC2_9CHLO|nr:ribosomal protein S2 [Derbesia sp. WEST4838]AOP19144.1 ribosomal protein S2 [Derbesia sp. WEST4838]